MRPIALLLLVLAAAVTATPAAADPLDPATAPSAVRRAVFRAEASRGRDRTDEAVRILAEALADGDDRDHPALRYRLGAYLLDLGRPAEAMVHLERASVQADHSAAVWRDYARAAYETGTFETAARAFARAHGALEVPDPGLLYFSAVAWILAERPADAADVLVPLTAAAHDTIPLVWVQALVSAASASDAPARADGAVERVLRDHPAVPAAWELASQQAQLRNDLPRAAARLQVADWLSPLPPGEIRRLAELYGAAGIPRMSARTYARLWPGDPDLARPLAAAWMRAHEADSARVVLDAALAERPEAGMWMLRGDLEYEAGDWEAARRAFAQASRLDPEESRAWFMQGACGLKLEAYPEARAALERALTGGDYGDEAERLLRYLETVESPSR